MTKQKKENTSSIKRGLTTSIYVWFENVVALRLLAKKERITKNELINKLIRQEYEKLKES